MKLLYKPIGTIAGVVAGLIAGAIFKRVWQVVAHEEDKPDAKDKHRSWTEVIAAATVEGAIFAGVKAGVDRAGAEGFERLTGVWPGNTEPIKR
jgi:predicted metal-dependent enzyme (double-stranded beta helix superfamily)